MNRFVQGMILAAVMVLASYLVIAFVNLDFDLRAWSDIDRMFMATFSIVGYVLAVAASRAE